MKYLQFKYEDHFVLILEGVVEVDELAVVEMVHDVNLLLDQRLLHGVADGDELGGEDVLCLELPAPVHHAERPGADLLEDLVVVVHAGLGVDLHGLGDVLGVDVEHELVVVLDLALLSPDLLAGVRINWKFGYRSAACLLSYHPC